MNPVKGLNQRLVTLFSTLLGAQLVFAAIVIFVLQPTQQIDPNESIYMALCSALLFIGIVAGMVISRSRLKLLSEKSLEEKFMPYTTLSLIRLAPIEGAVLLSIICFLLTGNQIFLIFTGVGIVYFITLFPSKARMARELEISEEEFLD